MKPFVQLPFADVPDLPRVPHSFGRTEWQTVAIPWEETTIDIHVRTLGPVGAPPLLLVHGFMTSSYSWRYVIEDLARDHRVYAPDLPGAGRSAKPRGSYSADVLAKAIGSIIDVLGIRGTKAIGNSLGGYLCMRLALRDPTAISRLVNLHSPGVPTPRVWALKVALKAVPMSETLVRKLVWINPEKWAHQNVHYYDETLKSREEHREYAAPLRTPEGVHAFYRMLAETLDPSDMRSFAQSLAARPFPIPLQLIYAKRDPMVPPAVGKALAKLIPAAPYVELARGSHFAHVDAPELFLAAARPFLAGA